MTGVVDAPVVDTGRRRADLALAVAVGWTLFVWGGRLRNLIRDGEDAPVSWVLSIVFCVLAVVVIGRRLSGGAPRPTLGVVTILAVVATGVWVVRGVQIATADHSAGFIAVHTVLALVSIATAWWARRAVAASS